MLGESPFHSQAASDTGEDLIPDQAGFIQGMGSAQFGHLGGSKGGLKQDLGHLETGTGLGGSAFI